MIHTLNTASKLWKTLLVCFFTAENIENIIVAEPKKVLENKRKILEKSWKSSGIFFSHIAWNPVIRLLWSSDEIRKFFII